MGIIFGRNVLGVAFCLRSALAETKPKKMPMNQN
jgi:hypothetical protein